MQNIFVWIDFNTDSPCAWRTLKIPHLCQIWPFFAKIITSWTLFLAKSSWNFIRYLFSAQKWCEKLILVVKSRIWNFYYTSEMNQIILSISYIKCDPWWSFQVDSIKINHISKCSAALGKTKKYNLAGAFSSNISAILHGTPPPYWNHDLPPKLNAPQMGTFFLSVPD